jgi:hypothetical protein
MTGGGVSADGPAARLVARGMLDRLQRLASELRAAGAEIALS